MGTRRGNLREDGTVNKDAFLRLVDTAFLVAILAVAAVGVGTLFQPQETTTTDQRVILPMTFVQFNGYDLPVYEGCTNLTFPVDSLPIVTFMSPTVSDVPFAFSLLQHQRTGAVVGADGIVNTTSLSVTVVGDGSPYATCVQAYTGESFVIETAVTSPDYRAGLTL
jgi:hypothetical protein